jgi:hypothetical protein
MITFETATFNHGILIPIMKPQTEDGHLESDISAAEHAIDYHTIENRNKRKVFQERRHVVAQQINVLGQNIQSGQQTIAQLHTSVETNLALAEHAETWAWKEIEASRQNAQSK